MYARIHHTAYEMRRMPLLGSNFCTAFIRPMFPSWMRSAILMPYERYSYATLTTKRRLEVTSLCAASRSPLFAYRRASRCSSSTVRSGYLLISARYMASEPVLDGRADGCMVVPPGQCDASCLQQARCHLWWNAFSQGLDAVAPDARAEPR